MSSKVPAVVGQHLDAIRCISDDRIILGSSDLTRRYWNGSLWYFQTIEDAPDVESCTAGIDLSSGICDIAMYNNDKVAVGLDSGGLEFYHYNSETPNFNLIFGAYDHDDFITSLSLTCDKSNLVSVGADRCVKIWNLETFCTTHTFRPVHGGTIWQVTCSAEDPQTFLTCGQDGKILLFDCRLPKPATVIDSNPLKGEITSAAWKPSNPSLVAVGDESGQVSLKDIRNNNTLFTWQVHKRRIHRMSFSNDNSWLATCGDDTHVCVSDVTKEEPTTVYKGDNHSDFVRDVTWNSKNDLISCGWDKKVFTHVINENN